MLKVIFALGVVGVALSAAPAAYASGAGAAARNYQCNDVDMKELQARGEAMTDAGKKAAFMKEMQMANDSMTAKDMQACANHMGNLTNMFSN